MGINRQLTFNGDGDHTHDLVLASALHMGDDVNALSGIAEAIILPGEAINLLSHQSVSQTCGDEVDVGQGDL